MQETTTQPLETQPSHTFAQHEELRLAHLETTADSTTFHDPINLGLLRRLRDRDYSRFVEIKQNASDCQIFGQDFDRMVEETQKGVRTPEPLRRETPPSKRYPVEALGTLMAPLVQRLMEVVQAPDALCAQAVLAAAGLAVQAHANIEIDGRRMPISEFFLTIGESGERKSSVDTWALRPHKQYERTLYEGWQQTDLDYRNSLDAYKKAREEALKKAKGYHAKREALTTLGDPPNPPLKPILTTEEPTYEGLIRLLLDGQPSIGLFSDEGGRLIGGHGMNSDNQLKTAAGLSELWDGKRITRVRAAEGATVLYGRRLSIHLMAQPAVAQGLIRNRLLLEQGLLSRCLVAWPTSTVGNRPYQEIALDTDTALALYESRIGAILNAPFPLEDDSRNELSPRPLVLDSDAKQVWIVFYNHIEEALQADSPLAPVRGFGSKVAEHALRLAGILTLVDDLDAGAIDRNHAEAGITLAQFYLEEALRLFGCGEADPELLLAEQLLLWAQGRGELLALPDIYQYGPPSIRDAKTARQLVTILEEHGWLNRLTGGATVNEVFRRDAWEVVK